MPRTSTPAAPATPPEDNLKVCEAIWAKLKASHQNEPPSQREVVNHNSHPPTVHPKRLSWNPSARRDWLIFHLAHQQEVARALDGSEEEWASLMELKAHNALAGEDWRRLRALEPIRYELEQYRRQLAGLREELPTLAPADLLQAYQELQDAAARLTGLDKVPAIGPAIASLRLEALTRAEAIREALTTKTWAQLRKVNL